MKLEIRIVLTAPLVLALAMPALAQVEKAAMRTTGISCGVCAVVSEVNIRRIEGVDEITISMSNETLMISYEPDALFESVEIRKVLESLDVGITVFQISARGRVEDQGEKRFFVAGRNRFVLAAPTGNAPRVPSDTPVVVEAVLNDQLDPMELTVMAFKMVAE